MLSMDTGKRGVSARGNVPSTAQAYIAPLVQANKENGVPNIKSGGLVGVGGLWGGGAEVCPRCQQAVYLAERMRAAGHAYHKTCFTCYSCNKKLDSGCLAEKEQNIY